MNIKKVLIAIVCIFTTMNIWAQYTCYVGGADIKIYAPPTNYSRYPDLYEVRWNVQGGGTNVIMLIGNTLNPVTVRPIGAGTATIICSATYYDKSLGNAAGKSTVIENYTVTCIDNSGGGTGGGGTGGGNSGGGDIKVGDYFQDYTAEGDLMLFIAGTMTWGELYAAVVRNKYGGACINNAKGRVTIPSIAQGIRVYSIGNAAFNNLSGLTELVIPSSVTSVDSNITYMCENLTIIICEATTPPAFYGYDEICDYSYKLTLYVPKGCKSLYESANGWKRFGTIKEIGEESGIDDIMADEKYTPIYNISGQRVNTTQKGLYIINGKKVVVK